MKIEPRKELWKKRTYKVVESGKNFQILRPYEFDMEKELQKLLKKKKKLE